MMNLTNVDQAFRRATDGRQIPGVVAMAATDNEVIYQGAFGKRDLGKPEAMTLDSVFWIASMTKAITATAAMQLISRASSRSTSRSEKFSRTSPRRRSSTASTRPAHQNSATPSGRSRCAIS